jgi:hypothetical protein
VLQLSKNEIAKWYAYNADTRIGGDYGQGGPHTGTDFMFHMSTTRSYARMCGSVLELGISNVKSSWAILAAGLDRRAAGLPFRFDMFDQTEAPFIPSFERCWRAALTCARRTLWQTTSAQR